jgi:tripartite-type tricarboxylate transporter receptor subunit TctC
MRWLFEGRRSRDIDPSPLAGRVAAKRPVGAVAINTLPPPPRCARHLPRLAGEDQRAPFPTRRSVFAAAAALITAPSILRAQTPWPSQVIKFIVPFAPGGSTDILARVIAQKLEAPLKANIIIENRAGAGGSVAANAVAKADADGHSFMMGHIGTLAFTPSLYPNLPYDPVKDFAPVALVATVPNILAVHPSLPVKSVTEFAAYAKANPGKLNYGSGGVGSAAHVAGAYLAFAAGFEATHVPYRGTAPMVNDLVGGNIQFTLTGGPAVLPLAASGHVRTLAVSSRERAAFAPELPTIAESGVANFDAVQWYGLVAPAKTPDAIVRRMNAAINALLGSPEVEATLRNDGAIAAPTTPEAFGAQIQSEIATWRDVIRRAGITAGG